MDKKYSVIWDARGSGKFNQRMKKNGFFNQGESGKLVCLFLNLWTSTGIKTTHWCCLAVRTVSPQRRGGNPTMSLGHARYVGRMPKVAKLYILSVRLMAYVDNLPRDTKCHQTSVGLLPVKSAGRAGSMMPTETHGPPSATSTTG